MISLNFPRSKKKSITVNFLFLTTEIIIDCLQVQQKHEKCRAVFKINYEFFKVKNIIFKGFLRIHGCETLIFYRFLKYFHY